MSIDPEQLLKLAKDRHGPAGVTLSWPMVINIVDELRRLQQGYDELAAHVDALHGVILGPLVASYTDAESAEEARRIAMSGPTRSLARRDAQMRMEGAMGVRDHFRAKAKRLWASDRVPSAFFEQSANVADAKVQEYSRQAEEAPCSSTSPSASPSASC